MQRRQDEGGVDPKAAANATSRRTRVVDQVKLGLQQFKHVAALAHRAVGTQAASLRDIGRSYAEWLVVNCRVGCCPTHDRCGRRVAAGGVIVVNTAGRIVVRRLVPLVHAGQEINRVFVAKQVFTAHLPRLATAPQPEVAIAVDVVGRLMTLARVEPVDERSCLQPADGGGGFVRSASVLGQPQTALGVGRIDHRFGDFVLADPVVVINPTRRVGSARGVVRVARVANGDKFDVKLAECTKGVGVNHRRSQQEQCYAETGERGGSFYLLHLNRSVVGCQQVVRIMTVSLATHIGRLGRAGKKV